MFKKENWFKLLLWVMVFFGATTGVCGLLTLASTVANLFGIVLMLITIYVSVKTECFTKINFKKEKKNEESN